ncbi:MAG: ABC transporter ATP-binding protein, partial [Acholeplasmataceae bacterium]|nr:ABC transporter ATP-binding protein [Acholeplasmataceae bacterium]
MKNYKRLFHFIKGRYPYFFLSIAMILLIQVLSFLSPLLVKTILDDYLLGIEYPWVEVKFEDAYTVNYQGRFFKQDRHVD